MIKKSYIIIIIFLFQSCGYPDVDDVPIFNNISFNDEEIVDYCNNIHSLKTNIEKCINDYSGEN
tara:strand:- start:269 stop:460 length:192 start_codon:yes stop_codon:yes gene_type:complete